jgi:phage gpG-like protein
MANIFNLRKVEAHFKSILLYAPGILGNEAVNFFIDSFRNQGWLNNRFEPWKKRKSKIGTGRSILVQTGRLRRGIRITSNSGGKVIIGNDAPYAKAHNDGFRGTVRVVAHERNQYSKSKVGTGKLTKKGKERMKTVSTISNTFVVKAHARRMNMPVRRFMGESQYLTIRLKRILAAELNKGLR